MLALLQTTSGYRILGLLHILSAMAAFGPLFLYTPLKKVGETTAIAKLHLRLVMPALVLMWVFGMGLAGVGGVKGVPRDVAAVALNVTAVSTEAGDVGGFVTVYPCGDRPNTPNLNFMSGQTVPNSVIAPVSSSGKVCFYVYGRAHLLTDVSGHFTS